MRMSMKLVTLAVFATGFAACAAPEGVSKPTDTHESSADMPEDGDPNEVFTQTVVVQREDGTFDYYSYPITRAEQWALRKRTTASNYSVHDTEVRPMGQWGATQACDGSNAQIWDQPYRVGNSTCFRWVRLTTPPIPDIIWPTDLAAVYRGPETECGFHTWYEPDQACICFNSPITGRTCNWSIPTGGSPSPYGRVRSAQNMGSHLFVLSNDPSYETGYNFTIPPGTVIDEFSMFVGVNAFRWAKTEGPR